MTQRIYPPLPPDLVAFVEGGPSMLVGTRDEALRPDAVRALGVRVWPGASRLTVYLAATTSTRAVANARATGQLALTMSHPPTHLTYQIKGAVLDVREAASEDRTVIDRYVDDFAEVLASVGLPRHITRRLTVWPAFALDVDIAEVFAQTPGPDAGSRMSSK
jgi:hypothetical protein